jgi:archaeosine synthase
MFQRILRKFREFPDFQEFILTSPLGVVPRQLEDIYPVSSYDISVTGDWDETEICITSKMLIDILNKFNDNIPIICHLEGEYSKIAKTANSKLPHKFYYTTTVKKTITKESLNSLKELVEKHIDDFKPIEQLPDGDFLFKSWIRKFIKILDYQFGSDSGKKIIVNSLKPIKPKPNSQIDLLDFKTGDRLGVFKPASGQIDLTIKGANRLFQYPFSLDSNIIIFDGQKIQGTNLFRPGIIEYNSHLIPGDGVVVIDKEKKRIIGVGRMIVGSNFIKNSKTGKVVEIYEKQ